MMEQPTLDEQRAVLRRAADLAVPDWAVSKFLRDEADTLDPNPIAMSYAHRIIANGGPL